MRQSTSRPVAGEAFCLIALGILAIATGGLYVAVGLLSRQFQFGAPPKDRPILLVLSLLGAALVLYLAAGWWATRSPQTRRLLVLIVGTSVLFRLILLPSTPIQEIDIYRYLWDGSVSVAGVSPFRYPPAAVLRAADHAGHDADLQRLAALLQRDPVLAATVRRIHYRQLPTVYPPVSQAVFAAATLATPPHWPLQWRVGIMKAWFVGFDLATLWLVVKLLQAVGKPMGWSLLYGWCPLLMKEVANSGHLDALAVFLATLAVYLAVRLPQRRPNDPNPAETARKVQRLYGTASLCVLGLAVGAKLYPVVLAPLLLAMIGRKRGWRCAVLPALAFAATTLLVLWPMLPTGQREVTGRTSPPGGASEALGPPAAPAGTGPVDPSLGLRAFLSTWEMNDFLFMLAVENLKPESAIGPGRRAWFTCAPDRWRAAVAGGLAARIGRPPWEAAFLIARAAATFVFLLVMAALVRQGWRSGSSIVWLQCAFLTIAWFWLLCPTQNPWYWTWALPLLPFARSRVWSLMSGLVLLYYLRFWFAYQWPDTAVPGTPYVGFVFFDFVVTWVEYAPWLVLLAAGYLWSRGRHLGVPGPPA